MVVVEVQTPAHDHVREPFEPAVLAWSIPPTRWAAQTHPRATEVVKEVDDYYMQNWSFHNDHAKNIFVKSGFSRITCQFFPEAKDDRVHFACRLLTVLFLIDDVLEVMSIDEGSAYVERLFPIMTGDAQPDRSVPAQWIMYDLVESMRAVDAELTRATPDASIVFMRAQVDRVRMTISDLGGYLEYRKRDVGKGVMSALHRFAADLHLTPTDVAAIQALEFNCAKHIAVVNDIYSWEKEVQVAKTLHAEGAHLCTAVRILADAATLDVPAAKRLLWHMVREFERVHDELVTAATAAGCSATLAACMKGLEYQASGNEAWSRTTTRYKDY